MIYYYISIISTFVLFSALFIVLDRKIKNEKGKTWLLRGLSLLFASVFIARYLSADFKIRYIIGLNINSIFGVDGINQAVLSLFVFWFTMTATVLLETYPFFKDKVFILKHLVKFFAPIIYILSIVTLKTHITALFGTQAVDKVFYGGIMYSIEIGLALTMILSVWIKEYRTHISGKFIRDFILSLLGMILVSVPCFAFQLLFGKGNEGLLIEDFNFIHRMVLYGAFILPVIIILIMYRWDYDHKRYALLYMSLAICISYSIIYSFSDLTHLRSYPLHLCNLAVYMVPLCLIFKIPHFYYFTFFINVFGAFMAMLFPGLGNEATIFTSLTVKFWINHYDAFFMPIVIMVLGLYERPKMKEMGYSMMGFLGYFVLVLFVNAYYTSIGTPTDFFFINSDYIASKFGEGAKRLRLITATIKTKSGGEMVFYPLYQSLFYMVYNGVAFMMWYIYLVMFMLQDNLDDLFTKNRKYKSDMEALLKSLQGRNKGEPMNKNATNDLILNNFSKKYSTSNVYAVKDANLSIHGGEIFGFLGPNGAGKSTIIKSIVGIQSISGGSINVCGYDMEHQSTLAKMNIGFVPDHYALYENLSGREYINYIANLYGVSIEDRNKRMDEYVKRFNLEGAFENPIKTYSHGMKQKITIMSALIHNPKVWILDEPLTGLDPDSIYQVKETMKAHAKEGNIVFFSSHIIDVVEKICDRIAIIKNGHIIKTVSLKELETNNIQLEEFYRTTIEECKVERVIE